MLAVSAKVVDDLDWVFREQPTDDYGIDGQLEVVQGDILRPYTNGAGEVDFWKLELILNDLGRAFLVIDEFAEGEGKLLTPR